MRKGLDKMKSFLNLYIEKEREAMVQALSELIAIESVSSNLPKVREALDFVLQLGEGLGFSTSSVLDGQVGVIEMGEGEETLGILSHVDVVPAEPYDQWRTDPFQALVLDGCIYGRGAQDDKGMIIASLYAMKAVMEQGAPLHKKVQMIIGTQEEVEWTDMDAYVKSFPLPDYGFTPDGEYPISNIEKGFGDFLMEFHVEDEIARQAERLYVVEIHCGAASNVVPGAAEAILSDGRRVKAEGKTAHTSRPEKGINALFLLIDQLKDMGLGENRLWSILKAIDEKLRSPYGEALGLDSESEYYEGEFVHRNVLTPTILEAKDGLCKLNVNIRFAYGFDEGRIVDGFQDFARAAGGRIVEKEMQSAVFVSQKKPFLKAFAKAYEEVSGFKNEFSLAYGGSYAKAIPNVVAWGPIFPGEQDTCHEPNECIGIDSLLTSAKIFAQAFYEIGTTEKSFK
ncbi:MAG: M20 family metallopeptidase [Firmicutes bacterium]|nr:M20 family metallopeptidase [Bacillota bacterium]